MMSGIAKPKVRLRTFLHLWFQFLLCTTSYFSLSSCSVHFSHFKYTFHSNWNFLLITYFRDHVTEYFLVW